MNCALGGRGQDRLKGLPAGVIPRGRSRPHHQALNDAEVVVDDLGQGSQAVGRAGSVATEPEKQL